MPVEKSSEQRQVALDDTVCTEQRQVAANEPEGLVPSANSTTVSPSERMREVSSAEWLREITSQLQLLELERAAIITGGRNCTFPTEMPSSASTKRYPPSTKPARQTMKVQ
uniref:Uncharacterized protein n=1 Tax=Anopheles atroparvus TaxID=41427 RepID=A0A182IKX2_ANOAO